MDVQSNLNSVVGVLEIMGQDSSFANRVKIAASFGFKIYTGTAEENELLCKMIKNNGIKPR